MLGLFLTASAHAWAKDPGTSQFTTEGRSNQGGDQTLESRIVYSAAGYNAKLDALGGRVTPKTPWIPPACWYEPKWTPDEFEAEFQRRWSVPHFSGASEAFAMGQDRYVNGEPYEDFNKAKSGQGLWWSVVRDQSRADSGDPAAFACDEPAFWVDNGESPPVANALTPEVLAQLAYAAIRVPNTEIRMAPQGAAKVNLPTWAWLDSERFQEVSVTASLDVGGLHIEATTTATPVSLGLEPGTPDARTHPGSGECPINADGSIGRPYTAGQADREPPCGVTYLRASGESGYDLHATVTWDISWTGTGGAGGDLPDGTFGGEQTVVVQEIQSVNR
ncbi:hypothetical protein [Streptomyces sp. WMMC905]|uniref:hypothetical protein n=1 Tax=Streptomyces sp. WMMC905 TaxID=3404123 RepID=UPI003B94202E